MRLQSIAVLDAGFQFSFASLWRMSAQCGECCSMLHHVNRMINDMYVFPQAAEGTMWYHIIGKHIIEYRTV